MTETDDELWRTYADKQAAQDLALEWIRGHRDFEERLARLIADREADASRSTARSRAYVRDVIRLHADRIAQLEAQVAAVPAVYRPLLERLEADLADSRERERAAAARWSEHRALREEAEAEADGQTKITIRAGAGWDVESIEELAWRIRAGGGTDLTPVRFNGDYLAYSHVIAPEAVPLHPMRRPDPDPLALEKPTPDLVPAGRPQYTRGQILVSLTGLLLVVCWVVSMTMRAGVGQ